jgi:hypothetical protein
MKKSQPFGALKGFVMLVISEGKYFGNCEIVLCKITTIWKIFLAYKMTLEFNISFLFLFFT